MHGYTILKFKMREKVSGNSNSGPVFYHSVKVSQDILRPPHHTP